MQIGDKVRVRSVMDAEKGCQVIRRVREGTVIYIHPKERFFTVKYDEAGHLRECFPMNRTEEEDDGN